MTTPLTREAVKALRDDPARIAMDEDDDAYLLPSGSENNLVAIPARDDFAGEYQILNPEIWHQMVERFNAAPQLATALLAAWEERDALRKEFDAVAAMLSEMHGAEYSRAEVAEAERDAENARLREAIVGLRRTWRIGDLQDNDFTAALNKEPVNGIG